MFVLTQCEQIKHAAGGRLAQWRNVPHADHLLGLTAEKLEREKLWVTNDFTRGTKLIRN